MSSTSHILRNREFRKLWAGQGVSLFGSLVSRLVLPFFVIYTLLATPMEVAWIRVAEVLPGMLVGLLAGVLVDRWRRRHVLLIVDGVRAILMGLIPLLFVLRHLTLGIILGIVVLLSMAEVLFDSAYDAYLPTLVSAEQLGEANAQLSALGSVAEVTGFSIAGALFEWLGGPVTFVIDMLSFVISAVSLLAIRHSEPEPPRASLETGGRPIQLAEGLRLLWKHPLLRRIAAMDAVSNVFFGLSSTIYMLYVSRVLHIGPLFQGILYAVGGAGAFLTANVTTRLLTRIGYARALWVGTVLAAFGSAFLPLAFGPFWLLILFILGQQIVGDAGDTLVIVCLATLRQQQTDNQVLGRIRSAWLVVTAFGTLCGILLGGQLAEWLGLRDSLFVGVGIRLLVVVMAFFSTAIIHRSTSLSKENAGSAEV